MAHKRNSAIYIRVKPEEKKSLKEEAEKLGMALTTYCRMRLLESLPNKA